MVLSLNTALLLRVSELNSTAHLLSSKYLSLSKSTLFTTVYPILKESQYILYPGIFGIGDNEGVVHILNHDYLVLGQVHYRVIVPGNYIGLEADPELTIWLGFLPFLYPLLKFGIFAP